METKPVHLLSTRPLPQQLIQTAARQGIHIDCLSFIDTTPVESSNLQTAIAQWATQPLTAVFTSMNAVEAVAHYLTEPVSWRLYCMGHTTRQLAAAHIGPNICGTGSNADDLANTIINDGVKEVLFFCGNIRRDELPQKLKAAGVTVTEMTVYNTVETAHHISVPYHGILYFSPSAVHSFFSANKLPPETVCFAIGATTAAALQQYAAHNRIITGTAPAKEKLALQAIEYFTSRQQHLPKS